MKKIFKMTLKMLSWLVLALSILFCIQLSILAFPNPLFAAKLEYGQLVFHSDNPAELSETSFIKDVISRVSYCELYDSTLENDIYICNSKKLFSLLSKLSFLKSDILGFNLSVFNNSYISSGRLCDLRDSNSGFPPYSSLNGKISQCIAHELVHQMISDKIGVLNYRKLPTWKLEGYVEFSAARFEIDRQSSPLIERIADYLNDDKWWGWQNSGREYYSYSLTVEYLTRIENLDFEQLLGYPGSYLDARAAMIDWHNRQLSTAG